MLKIRINLDPTAENRLSGVGNYTVRLAEALASHPDIQAEGFYFNFRGHRHTPKTRSLGYKTFNFPLKIYAKLDSLGLRVPFDLFLPAVDATFFPNFATWQTLRSKLKITTIHDLTYRYFSETMDPKNLAHLKRVIPRATKKSDLILTVSKTIKRELINEFSIKPDKILALPIPPSDIFINFDPKNDYIPLPDSIKTDKIITFVGNFEPRKNLKVLVRAYLKLPAPIQEQYGLVIAGSSGWGNDETQKLINDAVKKGSNIFRLDSLEPIEVAALISQSSAFIMPSLYEGFGMPIVESMTVGTPVIASDIPVLHESSGEAALFFNPKSADDLAQQIQRLLSDTKLQSDLIAKGKDYVKTLSWSKNADLIYQKITSLLE